MKKENMLLQNTFSVCITKLNLKKLETFNAYDMVENPNCVQFFPVENC